jgi:hypothetical protein
MAQKKSTKTSPKAAPKKAVTEKKVTASKGPNPKVSSPEEAEKLVKENYKHPEYLEYTVLENGHVFYGINRGAALGVARRFCLKYFDVKF